MYSSFSLKHYRLHIHTHTYTHTHTYVHTHTHTHIHIHIHIHTHTYTYIYTQTRTYPYIHSHTHTYTYIYIHTHTHTRTYVRTHAHTHTRTHTHIHTHTYTHIHIHIHITVITRLCNGYKYQWLIHDYCSVSITKLLVLIKYIQWIKPMRNMHDSRVAGNMCDLFTIRTTQGTINRSNYTGKPINKYKRGCGNLLALFIHDYNDHCIQLVYTWLYVLRLNMNSYRLSTVRVPYKYYITECSVLKLNCDYCLCALTHY